MNTIAFRLLSKINYRGSCGACETCSSSSNSVVTAKPIRDVPTRARLVSHEVVDVPTDHTARYC